MRKLPYIVLLLLALGGCNFAVDGLGTQAPAVAPPSQADAGDPSATTTTADLAGPAAAADLGGPSVTPTMPGGGAGGTPQDCRTTGCGKGLTCCWTAQFECVPHQNCNGE